MKGHSIWLLVLILNWWLEGLYGLPVTEEFVEDDMELSAEQRQHLYKDQPGARNALLWSRYHWPNSTLVYAIGEGLSSNDVLRVEKAMQLISQRSCVRFRRTNSSSNEPRVVIERLGSGCSANVGYRGRRQRVHLSRGCMRNGVIQHELLHALAFVHEHNAPNRDEYVKIQWENVRPGKEGAFGKRTAQDVSDFGVGYDYGSVMHYGRYSFSKNNQATIVPFEMNAPIGNRDALSDKDYEKLNKVYC